jgi:hypothetical protein
MKTIILSIALLAGASGAALADMNNKPADYGVRSRTAVAVHALAVATHGSNARCDEAAGSKSNCGLTPGGTNSSSSR